MTGSDTIYSRELHCRIFGVSLLIDVNITPLTVVYGVPQGPILGIFFILLALINDVARLSHTIFFANDTTLLTQGPTLILTYESATVGLRVVSEWFGTSIHLLNAETPRG